MKIGAAVAEEEGGCNQNSLQILLTIKAGGQVNGGRRGIASSGISSSLNLAYLLNSTLHRVVK